MMKLPIATGVVLLLFVAATVGGSAGMSRATRSRTPGARAARVPNFRGRRAIPKPVLL